MVKKPAWRFVLIVKIWNFRWTEGAGHWVWLDDTDPRAFACSYTLLSGRPFYRRRPHHVLILFVCLSVCLSAPCLQLEGKRKGLRIPNLVGRVPGTPAPRGPISRSSGQRSRSRRLIALLAKNPHNFAACCPINLIFGRCRKDLLPPCTDLESPKTARTYSTARTAP